MHQLRYVLFVLIGASSYGVSASIIKLTLGAGYLTSDAMAGQYLFGFLMLLSVFLFTKKKNMPFKQVGELLFLGLLIGLTGIFYTESLARLSASIAVVILFQFTWIGILIEAIYEKKRPSHAKMLSILFLWFGTLFAGNVSSASDFNIAGIIYGFLAAITFALFFFFSGKMGDHLPAIQRSMIVTFGGLLLMFTIFSPRFVFDGTLTQGLWKYSILSGIFGIILPVVFFAMGTPHLDSGTATIIGAAELPSAIIAATFLLGEYVTTMQVVGVILILIGIAIPQIYNRWQRPPNIFKEKHIEIWGNDM